MTRGRAGEVGVPTRRTGRTRATGATGGTRATRRPRGTLSALAAALALVTASAGVAGADGPADGGAAYETARDARAVRGASVSTEGPRLRTGTYTDTIATGAKKYYRVALDDTSNAYVSAVLAPPPGVEVSPGDGLRISLESTDGAKCSVANEVTFGSTTARPIADYATRRIGPDRQCQSAGDYLFSIQWIGTGAGPGTTGWPVELKYMTEPGLVAGAATPSAPSGWSSKAPAPEPGQGAGAPVSGGTGFNDAPTVTPGAWKDELNPGESRFYKVPVQWGQQLLLNAEFANSTARQPPFVVGGLRLSLFNTARGFVRSVDADYVGKPASVGFAPAPASFANRTSAQDDTGAMRFSGWYYVRVSLDRQVDSPLPMTLRVGLQGEPQQGPAYNGDASAAGFGVGDGTGRRSGLPLRTIGIAGISVGTALVLALAVWAVLSRRGRGANTAPPVHWEL
ncbi:hypothetical protein AB0M39_10325 [Streptomyces sp. NPDC051907]|uniref:hypothetical protein n=1 Tax=Streptomyces sp. NPDC051907 TaxID=3155284 RepID=UPI00342D97E5